MHRIGIVCAGDTELAPFLMYMKNPNITKKAMLKFYEGTIRRVDVVAVCSGVCKVNAAIAAQLLIEVFHVNMVISAGTAGGIQESVKLFDTVIAEQTAYHDVANDILTDFHPWMPSIYFQTDRELLDAAKEFSLTSRFPIRFGTIVTGESFIEGKERERIRAKFAPLAVDMETASVAHVCYVNRIPFIAFRTITDTAAHNGLENFESNCERASQISADIVAEWIDHVWENMTT